MLDLKPDVSLLESELIASYKLHNYNTYDIAENLFSGSALAPPPYVGTYVRSDNPSANLGGVGSYIDIEFYDNVRLWEIALTDLEGYSNPMNVYFNDNGVKGELVATTKTPTTTWQNIVELKKGRYRIELTSGRLVGEWYLEFKISNKNLILHDGEYKKFINKKTPTNLALNKPSFSSGEFAIAYAPSKAFDGSIDTFWYGKSVGGNQYVGVDLEDSFNIREVVLYQDISFRCGNFRIEYSDDNSLWATAYTGTLLNTLDAQAFSFNMGSHRYWRLYVVTNTSGGACGIAEMELYESLVVENYTWRKVSSDLPTSEQFLTDGMDELTPLLDRKVETLNPMPMTSKSDILPVGSDGKVFSRIVDFSKYLDIRSMKVEVK